MLRFALCAMLACAVSPARAQPVPLQPTPLAGIEVRDAALTNAGEETTQASLGHDLCLDSYQGLADEADAEGRILILWRCHGRDNQNVVLRDGVLYIGAAHAHRIEPMAAPAEGCTWRETGSLKRAYAIGVCREDAGQPAFIVDYPSETAARIGSLAGPGQSSAMRGTPLVAVSIPAAPAPTVAWEYDRRTHQLRVAGADLCLTPPSRDLSEGAPLYLDLCDAPHQIGERRSDGPRRGRVRFNMFWR